MAPELRTRKPKVPAESAMATDKPTKKKSSTTVTKRKAADDASPVTKKKSKVVKKVKAVPEATESNDDEGEAEEPSPFDEEEEERGNAASDALMKLIDSDAEEEEEGSADEGENTVSKVPKVPKHQKAIKGYEKEGPGVIYVGRIPHGFYEHQMRAFFSQFGDINKLRLSRNKKTGASKHFAFIEFAEESTADIVARTMDNYQMYERILKVKMVPRDQLHPDLWKGCNRRYKIVPWNKIVGSKLNKPKTEEQWNKSVSKEAKKRGKMAKKLKDMDYEFDMPTLAAPPKPVPVIAAAEAEGEDASEKGELLAIEAAPEPKEAEEQEKEKAVEDGEDATLGAKEAVDTPQPTKKGKKARQKKSKA